MKPSKNSKRATLTKALKLAKKEANAGRDVMVLLPSVTWVGDIPLTYGRLDAPGNRYIRFANSYSGFSPTAIDTLILVGRNDFAWDIRGEEFARERLRTSL